MKPNKFANKQTLPILLNLHTIDEYCNPFIKTFFNITASRRFDDIRYAFIQIAVKAVYILFKDIQ